MGDINSESFKGVEETVEIIEVISETFDLGGVTVEVDIETVKIDEVERDEPSPSDHPESRAIPTVIPNPGESPAVAMGNGYQMFSQSIGLLAQNAVHTQKQLTMTQQTATHQELQRVISAQFPASTVKSQNSLDNLQGLIAVLTSLSNL